MVYDRLKVSLDGTDPRNCAELAKHASRFASTIVVEHAGKTVSMKSLIGLISMGLTPQTEVTVRADGADEQAAMHEIRACI